MRVAYQAGVIRALADAGITFDHVDGTSGGTINLAMMLSGVGPIEMCDRWRALDVKQFVSFPPIGDYLHGPDLMAWGDARGFRDKVIPALGIDVRAITASQGIEGTFNVCNFARKIVETIPHRALTLDLLVAGVSLPIFMPPVKIDDMWYTDAVWIKDANLSEAVRRGADEIWVVWCIGNTEQYYPGAFHQYVHMIEMSAAGALNDELAAIATLNEGVRAGGASARRSRPVVVHLIKPMYPLPLDPDYYLGRITAETLIDFGYADASRYLATRSPGGVELGPEASRMQIPDPGIRFREVMTGSFALGATDPSAGEAQGGRDGTALTMHATITVRDLDRFMTDPAHAGTIAGDIDFPPIGTRLPASRGVFNLFSPTGDPTLRLMVYELAFTKGSERYYLAGQKRVRTGPVVDLWHDTTTLYSTLHSGDDATGPVIGAGVLHLGVTDLAHLATTLHGIDTSGVGGSAAAVAKFGEFFLGELWHTYGPGRAKA